MNQQKLYILYQLFVFVQTWTLAVDAGLRINITFLHFDIEDYSTCRYDWLQIEGEKYCGEWTTPFTIITNTNNVDVTFISDRSETRTGFLAIWSATTEPPTIPTAPVSCGEHSAVDCSLCPYNGDIYVGEGWCNGDCSWIDDECVLSNTATAEPPAGNGKLDWILLLLQLSDAVIL